MKNRIIVILIIIFFIDKPTTFAQVDSTIHNSIKQLEITTDKQDRFKILIIICEQTINDSLSFQKYSSQAFDLANELNDISGVAHINLIKGNYFLLNGKYEAGYEQVLSALKLYQKCNDQLKVGITNNAIGRLYNQWGKKDSSLFFYAAAEIIFKKLSAKKELSALYNNYGVSLAELGKRELALQYYLDALKIAEALNDDATITTTCNNLGKFMMEAKNYVEAKAYLTRCILVATSINDYSTKGKALLNFGNVFINEGNYTAGIHYFKMADTVFEKISYKRGIQAVNNNLGAIFLRQQKYNEAIPYLKKALAIAEASKSFSGVALIQQNIGYAYTNLKQFPEAKVWFVKAEQSALKYSDKYTLGEIYNHRASYDSAVGDFEQAFEYKSKFLVISDHLLNEKLASQISELQSKYNLQKKEQLIFEQQFQITKKNYLIAGISGLLILGSLLGFSNHKKNKLKQEKRFQAEILKQQDLATRAIIEAEEKERKRIASDLHDGVGQMMSAAKMNLSGFESRLKFANEEEKIAFEKIILLVDESCKEVRHVSHNMMPNALLKSGLSSAVKEFIEKIDGTVLKVNLYSEGLNDRLDRNVETVLYRVIQECVNNVIKHSGANMLDISLIKDKDGIAATIEDNGRGFDLNRKEKINGIGLKNIKTRIEYLKGTVDFDTSPGKGTLVAIHVPLG